jgi:lipopolysaccharide transport system ATP-binding protein
MSLSGNISDVVDRYLDIGKESDCEKEWLDPNQAPGDEVIKLVSVRIISKGEVTSNVDIDKDIFVEIKFSNFREGSFVATSIHLLHRTGIVVLATGNGISGTIDYDGWYGKPHPIGIYKTVCKIPANFLNEGLYSVNVIVLTDVSNIHARKDEAVSFQVHDNGEMRKEYTGTWIGVIRPKMDWKTQFETQLL